jgi:Domain of unknown function (DUF4129)
MATSFEKTSWRWQLEQFQQRFGEWIELKLRSDDRALNLDVFPPWLGVFLVRLTWLILAALIIWFGYRIIYPYWKRWIFTNRQQKSVERTTIDKAYTVAELLDRSHRFKGDGNYNEASRWLYLAMLQRLNDVKLIPQQLSRTDREYIQILRTVPHIEAGELLASTHEQVYFGNGIVTSEDFDRCQQTYHQIETSITQRENNPQHW